MLQVGLMNQTNGTNAKKIHLRKRPNIFIAQTGQRQFGPVLKVKITSPMFGFATKTLEH